MPSSATLDFRMAPSDSMARVVTSFFVGDRDRDLAGVAVPRPEVDLIVRLGPSARGGVDAHVVGVRERVHRKVIRAGMRVVVARLRLGAHRPVLGVSAAEIAGRIVRLEDLWGDAATGRLLERVASAHDAAESAAALERSIAERLANAGAEWDGSRLARDAAERLATDGVRAVADDLGVSERHLRRVFREDFGVSPKAFARLARFRRALRAAREDGCASWACIASAAGYYDQAHLIAEFRAIAGVTPRVLVAELRTGALSAMQ